MKRLLWFFVIDALLVVILVAAFDLGAFHSQIERFLSEKSGAKVQLGPLFVLPKWPLTLNVGVTHLESDALNIYFHSLKLELSSLQPPYGVAIQLRDPQVEIKGEGTFAENAPSTPGVLPSPAVETPLQLTLKIINGEIRSPSGQLSSLDLSFEQKLFKHSPATLHFKSYVQLAGLPLRVPIAVDTDALTFSAEKLKVNDLKFFIGVLQANVQGESNFIDQHYHWALAVEAADLTKLPNPASDLSFNDWRGAVRAHAEFNKKDATTAWAGDGEAQIDGLGAAIKYHKDKLNIEGPFALDLSGSFTTADAKLDIPRLSGSLDLTHAQLSYVDLFNKAAGVPLQFSLKASAEKSILQLHAFALVLWHATLKAQGRAFLQSPFPAQMQFAVTKTSLSGAESFFLPLADEPVRGEVALKGTVDGPLATPLRAHIRLEELQLKDFSGHFNYARPGLCKAKGPITVTLEGSGDWNVGSLTQLRARGRIGLTGAAVVLGPLRKEAGQNLSAEFQVDSRGANAQIQSFTLDSFFGHFSLSGGIKNLSAPKLGLQLDVQNLSLTELRRALPQYHEVIPGGTVSGNLRLSGALEPQMPWYDWPLKVEGAVQADLPEYVWPPLSPVVAAQQQSFAKTDVEDEGKSLVPSGALTRSVHLKVALDVGKLNKDKLQIQGLHTQGTIANGHFLGGMTIQEIFAGSAELTALDLPLLQRRPALQGSLKWQNMAIQEAVEFVQSKDRDFAIGRMNGHADFLSYLPGDVEFLSRIKAKGHVVMEPVTLDSIRLGQLVNDLIKQVAFIKMTPVKVEPLKGRLQAQFDLHDQILQLENLEASDVHNNELQAQGKVALHGLHGDLVGNFFWAQPQVKGCLLEGNADAQGRMTIPVMIKGDLLHPGLATLSDLVAKLGSKALQCEGRKLGEKLKRGDTKQLEEEVKKQLQGLFGH